MSVLQQIASASAQKSQTANEQLAQKIVAGNDKAAVKELVLHLTNKQKAITHDCIKVLYETGAEKPALIQEYADDFLNLLQSKDNRMQWGAMTAIDTITTLQPEKVFKKLKDIIAVAKAGSVITRDHCVGILIKLAALPKYKGVALKYLLEELNTAPTNQLPMYAEQLLPVVTGADTEAFKKLLSARLHEIEKESKQKRVAKVIGKLK